MKLNNIYFKNASSFNKKLQNAPVKFSFWKGRRFRIQDDLGRSYDLRLNDLIKLASKLDPTKKAFKAIVLKLKELEKAGNQFKEFTQANCLTQSMVKTIQFFSSKKNEKRKENIESLIKKIPEPFKESLEKKIDAMTLPISPDNPFYGTDLVVFKDDQKVLPLNGIYEKDLEEATRIYQDIENGKSSITIEHDEYYKNKQGVPFRTFVLECIRKLMTRPTGRKIFSKIISQKINVAIRGGAESKLDYQSNPKELFFNIRDKERPLTRLSNGKFDFADEDYFIDLGHELIHTLHLPPLEAPNLGRDYNSLDEQITITGLKKPLPRFSENDENFEPTEEEIEAFGYSDLNENKIRTEFGLKHREYHETIPDLKNENIYGKEASSEVSHYFRFLIKYGLIDELKVFLENHLYIATQEIFSITSDMYTLKSRNFLKSGLEWAAMYDQWEIFDLFLNKEALGGSTPKEEYFYLINCPINNDALRVLEHTLENPRIQDYLRQLTAFEKKDLLNVYRLRSEKHKNTNLSRVIQGKLDSLLS